MRILFPLSLVILFLLQGLDAQIPLDVRNKGSIGTGEIIQGNICLLSENFQFLLMVEESGDVVVKKIDKYELTDNKRWLENYELSHTWSLGTHGNGERCQLRFQQDGNLCLYKKDGSFIWCSDTSDGNELLILEQNGWLNMYNKHGESIWIVNDMIDWNKSSTASIAIQPMHFDDWIPEIRNCTCYCGFLNEMENTQNYIFAINGTRQFACMKIEGAVTKFTKTKEHSKALNNVVNKIYNYTGKKYDLEVRMVEVKKAELTTKYYEGYLILKSKDNTILKTKRLYGDCGCS